MTRRFGLLASETRSHSLSLGDFPHCDLRDAPEIIAQATGRIHQLLIRAIDQHFSVVKPKHGGYGHIFGYWAPGPTIALQEDALSLCHPNLYRDLFMNHSAEAVRRLGP